MSRVFVYGTLMKDRKNHRVLESIKPKFVGKAKLHSVYKLRDVGPFPALVRDGDTSRVVRCTTYGEVYEVPESAMRRLDAFEGVPHLYMRERGIVELLRKDAENIPNPPNEDDYDDFEDWETAYLHWRGKHGGAWDASLRNQAVDVYFYVFGDNKQGQLLPEIESGKWTAELDQAGYSGLPKEGK